MLGKQITKSLLVLGLMLGISGCGKTDGDFKTQEAGKTVKPADVKHDHGNGPHGGPVAHFGDTSQMVELTFTKEPREIAVYIIDHDDTSKAVAIDAKSLTLELHGESSPITLSADPQEGDPEGKASKFVVKGEAIPASITSVESIEGHVEGEVGGKSQEAEFGHHDH